MGMGWGRDGWYGNGVGWGQKVVPVQLCTLPTCTPTCRPSTVTRECKTLIMTHIYILSACNLVEGRDTWPLALRYTEVILCRCDATDFLKLTSLFYRKRRVSTFIQLKSLTDCHEIWNVWLLLYRDKQIPINKSPFAVLSALLLIRSTYTITEPCKLQTYKNTDGWHEMLHR